MIGGAKGIGIGIDFGIPNQYCRATSKPYIEKDVLDSLRVVASAYGKSNNDADRSIVKNLVDPDNPFVISNATYEGMSGHNGYPVVFGANKTWANESNGYVTSITSNTIHITNVLNAGLALLYSYVKYNGNLQNIKEIPPFKIEIKGLEGGAKFIYKYLATSDATKETNLYLENGTHELPKSFLPTEALIKDTAIGFSISPIEEGVTNFLSNITIKVLPEYEGAFVTDGIDGLITSTKTVQEMLGGSNELTIVSMVHQVKDSGNNVSFTNYIRGSANGYFRNIVNNYDKTGIYGYTSSDLIGLSVVNNILGDKNDYIANGDNRDSIINGNFSVQGYSYNDGNNTGDFSSVAWYWTIIANKVLTTDQINQVIAYFNLDRTLKPDILCNTIKQGITNENHAEFGDKLIDFSGNGRDIQLNNLAWKGGSGIAAKQYETFKDWTNTSYQTSTVTEIDEFTRVVDSTSNAYWVSMINRTSDFDKVHDSINIVLYQDDMLLVHECKYKIDENVTTKALYETLKSGVNTITLATIDKFTDIPEDAEIMSLGEWVNPKSNKGSVKITLLPSYKGGLLLDGVNDFGKVTGMPIYKDYTVVTDREIFANIGAISSKNNPGAFVETAENSVYSFGQATSGLNFISTRSISYLSKYSYCGQSITAGAAEDGTDMWLGTIRDNDYRFFNGAIYSLMSFPYSMSEFLIERQLKKHKLGTLYPNMVEFRPVIKSSVELVNKPSFAIRGTSTLLNAGDYIPENSEIWVVITMNNVADRITKFVINGNTIDIPSSAYNPSTMKYGFPFTIDSKSPQKITMTIEQDENYVKWNPVVESNVEYASISYLLRIPGQGTVIPVIGQYYPILSTNTPLVVYVATNGVDEVANLTINGQEPTSSSIHVDGRFKFEFPFNNSPQKINITIDEYIRFEDIVQPYPLFFEFTDENGNLISWGGKAKVGSTITRTKGVNYVNLLEGLFTITNPRLNGVPLTSSQHVVEKSMVFTCTATWAFDNNEPKVILSPRLLRIPNSSYKILGYIPDISGHGNNGKINNSAYAEGSGVNEDGSYQFDGVDDFVTIPTLSSGGKQVLMKVNSRKSDCYLYDQRNNWTQYLGIFSTKDFIAYNYSNQRGKTYIDGILNENITANDLIGITHNITVTNNRNDVKQYSPCIGTSFARNSYAQMALYDFMLFDDISTDDKIKELNEYVGIEAKVELPPYYWDAYGKTNLDADKATIQQRGVAVGDYDLTNYNHAYDKMSGYDGYEFAKFDNELDWYLTPDNGYIDVVSRNGYSITLKNLRTSDYGWYFQNSTVKEFITKDIPFKVKANKSIRVYWGMHSYKSNGENFGYVVNNITLNPNEDTSINLRHLTEEELTELGANKDRMYYLLWFDLSTLAVDEKVTIEMLPLYPNGLVYDGVEDFSVNKNIPIIDDFTVIAKRTWLEENISDKPFIIKGDTLYPDGNQNAFLFEYGKLSTYSFGQNNKYDESVVPSLISWATPTSYNGTTSLVKGSAIDTVGIDIAHATKMVLYKLILYPKTISLLEINFLKNLMEKDEIIDLTNPIFIQ
nr:MAG TPA: hypothetical protein [Caudoviricetes sp.]